MITRIPTFFLALFLALFLVSCDSGEETPPPLAGTWVAEDTVTIAIDGKGVEGIRTQTYELSEERGRIEGEYALVIVGPSGVFLSEEGLSVTGHYDYPAVSLTVVPSMDPPRATRTGAIREDGIAIDFPAELGIGGPFVLRRQ